MSPSTAWKSFHIGLSPTFLKLRLLARNSIEVFTSSKVRPGLALYLMVMRFIMSFKSMRVVAFIKGIIDLINFAFVSCGTTPDISYGRTPWAGNFRVDGSDRSEGSDGRDGSDGAVAAGTLAR